MAVNTLLQELIDLAQTHRSDVRFDFLAGSVYTQALSSRERQDFARLLALARDQQVSDPRFEPVYRHLMHLYVLNGSRLDVLAKLDRRVRGVVARQAAVVLIAGDSGIGKTTLVMALRERIEYLGGQLIVVRSGENETAPYMLWRNIVSAIAQSTDASTEKLPAPLGDGPPPTSTEHLIGCLLGWLDRLAARMPLVILLDDLQWADEDSLVALNRVTGRDRPPPLLFVGTYRTEEKEFGHPFYDHWPKLQRNRQFDWIRLAPWTRNDIERLVTSMVGPSSAALPAYLYEQAQGHPLFTVELLQDLLEQGSLQRNDAGYWMPPEGPASVPRVLRQLIGRRVERLGRDVEQLLNTAAVVGENWSLAIVEQLLDFREERLLLALESALNANLLAIAEDKREIYRFAHGLIGEVLYDRQLARRRKRLHAKVARQFERQQPTNVFATAHHYLEGQVWTKAAEHCLRAGEQAVQQYAFYSALQWYQKALRAAEETREALDPATHHTIYDRLGRTYLSLELPRDAEIVYGRLRESARNSGDLVIEGYALVNVANAQIKQYQFEAAEISASQALRIGEQTGDQRLVAQVHTCLGLLRLYEGQLQKAVNHLDRAQLNFDRLDDFALRSEILKLRSYVEIWAGKFQEATAHADLSIDNAQKSSDPLVQLSGHQNLGWSQIESGKYVQAYYNLLRVIEGGDISEALHHNLPRVLNLMGYLHLELGGAEQALTWDQKALKASQLREGRGNYEMQRYSLLNIATDYLHLGRVQEALATVAHFESIKVAIGSLHFRYFNRYQLLLCELHLTLNELEGAIHQAQEARHLANEKGVLKNIAKSHWFEGQALARMTRYDEALEHLATAQGIVDDIKHGSLPWKVRLSLAEVQQNSGQASQSTLQEARQMVDKTAHSLSESPLQAIFLASSWIKKIEGLEKDLLPRSPSYPAGLTRREVEVLQLVASGATNQQVADVLHISVRTVNTHMTNILNKTGCENRTAATVFAIQHNIAST